MTKAASNGLVHENPLGTKLGEGERKVAHHLEGFFEALNHSALEYTPNTLANYLLVLCREYNSYYGTTNIIRDKNVAGLLVSEATLRIIELGLELLGIKVPEKMGSKSND